MLDDVAVSVTRDYGATATEKVNELLFHGACDSVDRRSHHGGDRLA